MNAVATASENATTTADPVDRRARRPTRADARRNYDALLVAADQAFRANGVDTSLEDIAREAGVAIGTLYRHFPAREVLLEAVLHDELGRLRGEAGELLDHPSPGDAVTTWLEALISHAAAYRGLPETLLDHFHDEASALAASHRAMAEVGQRLLEQAQAAGEVRSDIDIAGFFQLSCALSSIIERTPGDHARHEVLAAVVTDGLRTVRPAS
jgi:AcrR family transcriptional regulator